MATIGEVFHTAATQPGTTVVTVVSNQGDAIASYLVGDMGFVPSPKSVILGEPAVFLRSHLASLGVAKVLFSDRDLPTPDPSGGPVQLEQPFSIEAANTATLALAPAGSGDSSSKTWNVHLALPAPFNRQFDFAATVIGSTIVGSTPAIGISEHVDHATHVISLRFSPAPK